MRDARSAGQPGRETRIAEHARSDWSRDLSDPGAVPGASTETEVVVSDDWLCCRRVASCEALMWTGTLGVGAVLAPGSELDGTKGEIGRAEKRHFHKVAVQLDPARFSSDRICVRTRLWWCGARGGGRPLMDPTWGDQACELLWYERHWSFSQALSLAAAARAA